jgi:hypothetical protein
MHFGLKEWCAGSSISTVTTSPRLGAGIVLVSVSHAIKSPFRLMFSVRIAPWMRFAGVAT